MDKFNMLKEYEGSWALFYTELSFYAMKNYHSVFFGVKNSRSVAIGKNRYYKIIVQSGKIPHL